MTSRKTKAAFIDRDGVINEERSYVYRPIDFVLLPGVVEGLSLLRELGYALIVVSNQSGVARGFYTESDIELLHNYMRKELSTAGAPIDGIYYCPHHPSGSVATLAINCDCRKPSPGMIFRAAIEFDIDLRSSVMIGDRITDVQAGHNAGVSLNIIVESGHPVATDCFFEADFVASDLWAAARWLAR